MNYVLAAVALIIAAWANGRFWRSKWTTTPTLHYSPTEGGDGRTLIFVWTGAFNDVLVATSRQIKLLQLVGDVVAIRYPEKRYSKEQAVLVAYDYLVRNRDKYDTVILDGWSLGVGTALLFRKHLRANMRNPPILKAMLSDAALGGHRLKALPKPWMRWIVMRLSVGPLFNLLSSWIMRATFKKMRIRDDERVDGNQLTLHMEAMWRLTLSALLEQVKAIIELSQFEAVTDMETVYFSCEYDEVIDGPATLGDIRKLFGLWLVGVKVVPGGHNQVVERHIWWRNARIQALALLGYLVGHTVDV